MPRHIYPTRATKKAFPRRNGFCRAGTLFFGEKRLLLKLGDDFRRSDVALQFHDF